MRRLRGTIIVRHAIIYIFIVVVLFFFLSDIRSLFTPLTSAGGESRWWESGGREKRGGAESRRERRWRWRGGRGSEKRTRGKAVLWPETWSARRQFFGRNRSHSAPWNSDRAHTPLLDKRFRREDRGRHVGTIMVAGPHLPLPVDNVYRAWVLRRSPGR